MASTYLSWTPSNTGTRTTFTWSFWVKRHGLGSYQKIHDADYNNDANYYCSLFFKNDDTLVMSNIDAGSTNINWATTRKFRDVNAWYHIVVTFDTTNGTANDRIRCYVNGERETLTGTFAVAQGTDNTFWNRSGNKNWIGAKSVSVSDYLDATLSHFHFIDGTAYDASTFGQYDANGVWTINTSPSVTYGTNGFFILKDGNSVTDQSPNTNNFTVSGGTLTKTEDCPSNVFATFNALIGNHTNGNTLVPNLDAGNTDAWINSAEWRIAQSTLGASSGKYYAEFKQSNDYGTDYTYIGIYDLDSYAQKISGYPYIADMANCFSIKNGNGNVYTNASDQGSYGTSYGNGDIIGIAMDLDNNKIYWSKNGTWMNSANPSNGTGGYSITADKTYAFGIQLFNNAWRGNFGNGYFGTTAVASAGTNASGIGIFEYDVPTGFTALSTKGLNL